MNHTSILNLTTDLGYKGFKEAYMRQIEDIAYHSLGFEERLYQLLQAQDVFLNNKRVSTASMSYFFIFKVPNFVYQRLVSND